MAPDPLILTARFDADTEAWLEALRRTHFPPERNLIAAHVTLFHALPGDELPSIAATLAEACAATPQGAARIGPPRSLGRGVALEVAAPALTRLRADLAAGWTAWLSPQDAQGWRPHATVQNKVSPEAARALLSQLAAKLAPREATATGLRLWHYRGGPWEAAAAFDFTP